MPYGQVSCPRRLDAAPPSGSFGRRHESRGACLWFRPPSAWGAASGSPHAVSSPLVRFSAGPPRVYPPRSTVPISHHGRQTTHIPASLSSASFVYVRIDAVCQPLVRPYGSLYRVVARDPKTFKLMRNGKPRIVSVDRLSPALAPPSSPLPPSWRDMVLSPSAPVFRPHSEFPRTWTVSLLATEMVWKLTQWSSGRCSC